MWSAVTLNLNADSDGDDTVDSGHPHAVAHSSWDSVSLEFVPHVANSSQDSVSHHPPAVASSWDAVSLGALEMVENRRHRTRDEILQDARHAKKAKREARSLAIHNFNNAASSREVADVRPALKPADIVDRLAVLSQHTHHELSVLATYMHHLASTCHSIAPSTKHLVKHEIWNRIDVTTRACDARLFKMSLNTYWRQRQLLAACCSSLRHHEHDSTEDAAQHNCAGT